MRSSRVPFLGVVFLSCWAHGSTPVTVPIPVPNPDTAGLWVFDESEGPVGEENWGIYDQSGNGNHGLRAPISTVANRPHYVAGGVSADSANYHLNFGTLSAAHVEIPDSASLDLTGGFTVEGWVNFNSIGGSQYLVSKRNTTGPASGYILEWSASSQTLQFSIGNGSSFQTVSSQGFAPVPGQWYHVAGVHNPQANPSQIYLYVNGQLNNSASASSTIATNNTPLWIGDWAAGGRHANARMDNIRLSPRVVPPAQLGFSNIPGPAKVIFGDSFESYSSTSDMVNRSSGQRNRWRVDAIGPASTYTLSTAHAHSGTRSIVVSHENAQGPGNKWVGPYYNLPIAATRDEPLVATEGWVSFTGIQNVGLYFQNQIWTGTETHYGVTMTNLVGGIQYWGDTQRWYYELPDHSSVAAFSDPIAYPGDLDRWHYYKFLCDYSKKEYVSFQFDDKQWDLSGLPFLVLPNFFPSSVIPVVDHNVRLLERPTAVYPYTARLALDDAAITVINSPDGWKTDTGGDWGISANWRGAIPDGVDSSANFGPVLSRTRTVFSDVMRTVGLIRFDSPQSYVLAGGGSLVVDVSTGSGSVVVLRGHHKLNLPVQLRDDTVVDVAMGATLTVADPIDLQEHSLQKAGMGTLLIQAPVIAASSISLTSGTMRLGTDQAIENLDIATEQEGDQAVDLAGHTLLIRTADRGAAEQQIYQDIRSAINSTTGRDGIYDSTTAAAGYAVGVTNCWVDSESSLSVLVRVVQNGDANLDGKVDLGDLELLAGSWQFEGQWDNGDFNYDEFVDRSDLLLLATNWRAVTDSGGALPLEDALQYVGLDPGVLPEPSACFAAFSLAQLCLGRRATRHPAPHP